ncbi:MAG: hypothetical protein WA192_07835 [Candidatus Acidiferrales bacterium]
MKRVALGLAVLSFLAVAPFVARAATTLGWDDFGYSGPHDVLYIQTNHSASGENAVVAYHRDPKDGSLTLLGDHDVKGTGNLNVNQRIGPDDTDQEVIVSTDYRYC